jgi:hypothetical protein
MIYNLKILIYICLDATKKGESNLFSVELFVHIFNLRKMQKIEIQKNLHYQKVSHIWRININISDPN